MVYLKIHNLKQYNKITTKVRTNYKSKEDPLYTKIYFLLHVSVLRVPSSVHQFQVVSRHSLQASPSLALLPVVVLSPFSLAVKNNSKRNVILANNPTDNGYTKIGS